MKLKLLAGLTLCVLSQTIFADISENKPSACPSLSAIQNVGVKDAFLMNDLWFFFIRKNDFGTANQWSFIMEGNIETHDKAQAIKEANNLLATLKTTSGPEKTTESGKVKWSCGYMSDEANPPEHGLFFGIAITPPDTNIP